MLKIGVLCSGKLGLAVLLKMAKEYGVRFILTDSKSIEIIEFAKNKSIPLYSGNPRDGKGYNFIMAIEVDVIASINYLFLIEEDIINHSKKLTFNIHGSLLPKYRGRTPHVWAIINGEKKTGITAHVIDTGCDTGKIIYQIEIPIEETDTGAKILEKFELAYYPLIKRVLFDVETDQLNLKTQNEEEATYFGKRSPEDGEIDWNWTREDIRNWIRAQAYPYPGAFTFYDQQKIIIDKVSFSELNTSDIQTNGEILRIKPKVVVKTKNGAIILEEIRTENCTFIQGNKFGNEYRKQENRR